MEHVGNHGASYRHRGSYKANCQKLKEDLLEYLTPGAALGEGWQCGEDQGEDQGKGSQLLIQSPGLRELPYS